MVIGNFCAICAAAVMAIYSSCVDSFMKDSSTNCPLHIYLAISSVFISAFSYATSIYMRNPVHLFSVDATNGLFGIFVTRYFYA